MPMEENARRNAATLSGASGECLQKELETWRRARAEKANEERPVVSANSLTRAGRDTPLIGFFFALFIFLFIYDAAHNRLGSSNGKFISFVDTCSNVFQYKEGLGSGSAGLEILRALEIFMATFFIKFFSQTLVSLLLDQTPVLFKGVRHIGFFLLGFALLWASPGDVVYVNMRKSRAVRVLVQMGGGLYKMRKAMFAVEVAASACSEPWWKGYGFSLLLAVLAIDGSSLTRRSVLWVERRHDCSFHCWLFDVWTHTTLKEVRYFAHNVLWMVTVNTLIPIGTITTGIWIVSRKEWANGITDDSFLWFRVALLAVFLWRAGIFKELSKIHTETLAMSRQVSDELKRKDKVDGKQKLNVMFAKVE